MKGRALCATLLLVVLPAQLAGPRGDPDPRKLIVLGIDGMDPGLLGEFMEQGLVPHLERLGQSGGFRSLGTSVPPQSPVAWSDLITGTDSGHHGIFDFVALDRRSLLPRLSTADSRFLPLEIAGLEFGPWRPCIADFCLPLGRSVTLQLRRGTAFWEILEQHGIPSTLFRIPANYPPIAAGRALSGMGTPDLRGSPGTFTYFTDDPEFEPGSVSGGLIRRARLGQGLYEGALEGPPNDYEKGRPTATVPFAVRVDPDHAVAELRIAEQRVLLNQGEWSTWIPVSFELVPWLVEVPGMVRFYLKELRPHFRLYASPVNIDPGEPAQPIAMPIEYARELFEATGPFYTQEMPEDTKALTRQVLSPTEFIEQSELVLDERRRLLRHELERFRNEQRRGLLFFYFSSLDQRSHMLWRQRDREHPYHDPHAPDEVANALRTVYAELDELVGEVMAALDEDTTLVVMSDHGFAPFRYQAHLNSWLEQNGYLALRDPARRDRYEWLQGIDWSRTRAFAIGLNSLYLSVRGRERFGIVDPGEREALAREIAAKLVRWVDPATGAPVVTQAAPREDVYHGPELAAAPDLLVGYARGYRASWATTTGKIPAGLLEPNDNEWSGDHCMDARTVPGVLLANRPLAPGPLHLRDLTVGILAHFDIEAPSYMPGRSVF